MFFYLFHNKCPISAFKNAYYTVREKDHWLWSSVQCTLYNIPLGDMSVPPEVAPSHLGPRGLLKDDFSCKDCLVVFSSSGRLKHHQKVSHKGPPAFHCATCPKAFRKLSSVGKHQQTCGGERPHACDTCGVTYKRADHLRRHRAKRHTPYPTPAIIKPEPRGIKKEEGETSSDQQSGPRDTHSYQEKAPRTDTPGTVRLVYSEPRPARPDPASEEDGGGRVFTKFNAGTANIAKN